MKVNSDNNSVNSLPYLSPAAVEILNIVERAETTVEDIAHLVATDKVLYTNIYKYLSSALISMRRSPKDLNEALNYLGLYGLRDLVFILAAKNLFSCPHNWEHSVIVAFTAKRMALRLALPEKKASEIYIAALVHDIGSMTLEKRKKTQYKNIKDEEDLYLRYSMEKGLFGENSIEISYKILKDAEVPQNILDIIRRQALEKEHEEYQIDNALIDLAHTLAFVDHTDHRDLDEALNSNLVKRFNLGSLNINLKFLKEVNSQVRDFICNY